MLFKDILKRQATSTLLLQLYRTSIDIMKIKSKQYFKCFFLGWLLYNLKYMQHCLCVYLS